MARKTVTIEEPTEKIEAPKKTIKKAKGVTTTCVNVRKDANIESEVVEILYAGTEINIENIKDVNGFYMLSNGYIMKDFVDIKEA